METTQQADARFLAWVKETVMWACSAGGRPPAAAQAAMKDVIGLIDGQTPQAAVRLVIEWAARMVTQDAARQAAGQN